MDGLARSFEMLAAILAVEVLAVHGPGAFIALLAARAGEFKGDGFSDLDDFHFVPFRLKLLPGRFPNNKENKHRARDQNGPDHFGPSNRAGNGNDG